MPQQIIQLLTGILLLEMYFDHVNLKEQPRCYALWNLECSASI